MVDMEQPWLMDLACDSMILLLWFMFQPWGSIKKLPWLMALPCDTIIKLLWFMDLFNSSIEKLLLVLLTASKLAVSALKALFIYV
jgi:hypothetical protein